MFDGLVRTEHRTGRERLDLTPYLSSRYAQVVLNLQAHPELRRIAEPVGKA